MAGNQLFAESCRRHLLVADIHQVDYLLQYKSEEKLEITFLNAN